MYQSVMAQRQGNGSSGVGYAFDLVVIKESLPDKNICVAASIQYGTQYQLGLDKRSQIAWPTVGDQWIIDRSMGHWALRTRITATKPSSITGSAATMTTATLQIISLLEGLGLVVDATTAAAVPIVSGSKNNLSAVNQTILSVLDSVGLIDDQTTAATLPVGVWQTVGGASPLPAFTSPWLNYNAAVYQGARYMIDEKGTVEMEGLVKTSAAVAGPSPIFMLPTGFRPQLTQVRDSYRNGAIAQQLEIANDGTVRAANFTSTTVGFMTLACRFSTL